MHLAVCKAEHPQLMAQVEGTFPPRAHPSYTKYGRKCGWPNEDDRLVQCGWNQ